jgi:phenylalanyl-tRNA synthetase beta chain
VKIVLPWLSELVAVPGDPERVAREIALRGFEVASVETGRIPAIDFEITANRPDCLSHVGLAREASAIWRLPLTMPDLSMPAAGPEEALSVSVEDAELCPRYCAQVFEVSIARSPEWLVERLEAAGVRPINNIVDVTNYVMLELGQPMHAFDLTRLAGRAIVVRCARAGERLRTLDGVDRTLEPDMLVIADAARASAVGGVMGGGDSEIGDATTLIALESAYFHAPSVRRTSKRLGLKTEASIRFERGADVECPPLGIRRAAALFHRIGAGRPRGGMIDVYPTRKAPVQLRLRQSRIGRVLGMEVPEADIPRILEPLGFGVGARTTEPEPGWTIDVPTFRVDVTREVDLIEDVGRHHGFDRLPVTFPPLESPQPAPDPRIGRDRRVRHVLLASGFSEAVTFAFIERQAAQPFCEPGWEPYAIANPLSEKFAVLRPSLIPGLLNSAAYNRRRERRDVRLFETGSRFTIEGEGRAVAFVWSGAAAGPHWSQPTRPADFFDAKGTLEQIAAAFGVEAEFSPLDVEMLVAGRSAEMRIARNGTTTRVGIVGQLHPAVTESRGFPASEEIYAGEIDLDRLSPGSERDDLRTEPLPRFPSIVRDVSILFDEALPAAAVRGTIRSAAPETLVSIVEFDRYHGKGVPEGRTSLSLRLTFRASDRTMTDEEAQSATERIVDALRAAHGAEQR